ncbi:MAG: type II toxin-antitoxin system PemK/MazF family toxin [Verrucomicrobiota bacterium]|nr:type II toxin-antitoxin system PemK/MazF family toxin [Verrucomicrobiota bacterium]
MVKPAVRTPRRGDVIWLNFTPQAGREQAGRRPAVVMSATNYNAKSGLALVCPITSHAKGYPFEVPLPSGIPVQGVVLSDHLRSLDWRTRRALHICKLPTQFLAEIIARIVPLLELEE